MSNLFKDVVLPIFGIAGSKSHLIPMARHFQHLGYVVAVPEYTFYPEGKIFNMVQDLRACIDWVRENIRYQS